MEIASKLLIINMIDTQQTASVSNIVTTEIQDNSFLLTSSLNLRKVTAFMVDSAAVEPGTMFKVQDF
jgi:hypothetical protein